MISNWPTKKIGEITDVYGGGTPSRSVAENWDNEIPWLTIKDTENFNVVGTAQYISKQGLQNSNAQLIPANSVNLSCTATIGNVSINRIPLSTNQQFNSFYPHKGLLAEFLAYELIYQKNNIKSLGGTTTFPFISKERISNLFIKVPSESVQKKIVDVLSSVDEVIQKTEQIIQKTEQLKRGLMNELLSKGIGHKKFKKTAIGEIPEDWKLKNLAELSKLITKGTTPTTYGYQFTESGVKFIKIENINNYGQIDIGKCKHISQNTHDFLQRSKLESGDILFSIAGALGRVAVVKDKNLPANINQALALIRLKNVKWVKYIAHVLSSNIVHDQILGNSVQLAQANVSLSKLSETYLPWPQRDEMEKITNIIDSIVNKLILSISFRNKLLIFKNGLMQDIFNQRVQIN